MSVPSEILGPTFCRPIEVTASIGYNYDFPAGSGVVRVGAGVYANIFHLLGELNADTWTEGKGWYHCVNIDSNGVAKIAVRSHPVESTGVYQPDSALADLTNLGYYDVYDMAIASYETPYLWRSTFRPSDQDNWIRRQTFRGKETETGILVGSSSNHTVSERKYNLPHEFTRRLLLSHAQDEYDRENCLEQIVQRSLTSYPSIATHPRTSGVWVVRDMAGLLVLDVGSGSYKIGHSVDWNTLENVALDKSITPYLYCSFSGRRGLGASASLPSSVIRSNASVSLHTVATVPTWVS